MPSLFVTGISAIVIARSIISAHHKLTKKYRETKTINTAFASSAAWRFSGSIRFLRGGPVSWLQDLHPIPAVHPAWLNVDSVFRRSARFGGWCRRRLLNNDDLLIVESIPITKSKAVKPVRKGRSPVHPSRGATRPAERLIRAKSKIGYGQNSDGHQSKQASKTPFSGCVISRHLIVASFKSSNYPSR